jgi:hypothetical protein
VNKVTDVVSATASYERWMASHTAVVQKDLALKHERMADSPFLFLRATFYRWIELFPAVCSDLVDAPHVTAVGDLHIENFGTWRDREGRLVWGVNDLDEAASLPYLSDLVRLAASVALGIDRGDVRLRFGQACEAICEGYSSSLERGGEPIVLSERHRALREVAFSEARDPKKFWAKMEELPRVRRPPPDVVRVLEQALPGRDVPYTVRTRVAGVGSLGRPRFVALATYEGGWLAREAKAWLPSAAAPATPRRSKAAIAVLRDGTRSPDPAWSIRGSWIVRRLAPDCSRIEIDDCRNAGRMEAASRDGMGDGEYPPRHARRWHNDFAGSAWPPQTMARTRDGRDGGRDDPRLENVGQGWTGIVRFPSTIGGKSFTSSYTSVINRSLLCCVSPSVVLS